MRQILQLPIETLPGATGRPQRQLTDYDRALAGILDDNGNPAWAFFAAPEYLTGDNVRNLAPNPVVVTTNNGTANGTEVVDDRLFFALPGARQVWPAMAHPTDEFTAFAVVRLATSGVAQHFVGTYPVPASGFAPEYGFNAGAGEPRVWSLGIVSTLAQYTPAVSLIGRTALMMWTFSVARGWSIWENGVEMVNQPAQNNPFDGGFASGAWRFFNGVRGHVGPFGLLTVDLARAEHSGSRRRIEAFLMEKYGIA